MLTSLAPDSRPGYGGDRRAFSSAGGYRNDGFSGMLRILCRCRTLLSELALTPA